MIHSTVACGLGVLLIVACAAGDEQAFDVGLEPAQLQDSIPSEALDDFTSVEAVLALDEVRLIAIVDGGRAVVQLSWGDTTSRLVARKGRGPGEVTSAAWLVRTPRGGFAVVETVGGYIHWFSSDLSLIESAPVPAGVVTGAWMTDAGIVIRTSDSPLSLAFVRVEEAGSTPIPVLQAISSMDVPNHTCRYCPAAVSREGTIVSSSSDTSYRLLRWSTAGDTLTPLSRTEVPPVNFSVAERDSIAAMWRGFQQDARARGREDLALRVQVLAASPRRAYKPRFLGTGIFFDESGRLFAQVSVADDTPAQLDVFSPDGRFRGSVVLPEGTVVRDVVRGKLVTVNEDSMGITSIRRLALW